MSLIINSVTMPPPDRDGIDLSIEKIWSKNTGRAASTLMNGDIKGRKTTWSIKWSNLSEDDFMKILLAADTDPFFPVTLINPRTKLQETKDFYSGAPKATLQDYSTGQRRYKGVVLELVQR